jgi:hypothetical protein
MPLKKIPLPPGFDKNDTPSQAEGRWIDGDNVRFQYNSPEKIGGWRQINSDIIVGAARDSHSWFDLQGNQYLAIGTNKILYVLYNQELYDITPLEADLLSCTFSTTSGSFFVSVNKTAHDLEPGDLLLFSSVTPPTGAGYSASDFTTNVFEVTSVTNANVFVVTMLTSATGTTSGTGSATVKPYVTVGPLVSTFGYGWGSGNWGNSTWGTPRTVTNTEIDAGQWSLDNYGQNLIATIKGGKTFQWNPNAGQGVDTRATVVPNNPTATTLTRVSDRDRHLIHFGTETIIGDPLSLDEMFIRFSSQEDIEDYIATSTNTAGTFRIDNGSKIVSCAKGKDYILVISDEAAYTMQFVGPPFTFSIRQVGSNCGAVSLHSSVFVEGSVFWMGNSGNFFQYDGTVKTLECDVENFVFQTGGGNLGINFANGELVFASHNSKFNEITWFYPTAGSNIIDRSVTYNYQNGTWTTGTLARTTYEDNTVFEYPIATKFLNNSTPNTPTINGVTQGGSYVFEHEVGVNEILNLTSVLTTTLAITSYIETGDFDMDIDGDGEYFIKVKKFIPDFKYLDSNIKITLNFKAYPADTTQLQGKTTVGPFTVTSTTDKVDTRARGRLASVRLETDTVDANWRYGVFRFDLQPDGKGGSGPQT